MNIEEAKVWLERMGPEAAAKVVHEHHHLKQHLCAQILTVPTGCDDWVQRAIDRARYMRTCENKLGILLQEASALFAKAKWDTRIEECWNCRGTGRVSGGEQCPICKGTGDHAF